MNVCDLKHIELAKQRHPEFFTGQKVLEIGALDVNGNVRGPFEDCAFTGVDWIEGKNVDIVMKGAELELPAESFDVLLSVNHLEHDPEWQETLTGALKPIRKGGLLLLRWAGPGSAAHGPEFDPHGEQGYYPKSLKEICDWLRQNGCEVAMEYGDTNPYIGPMMNVIAFKV